MSALVAALFGLGLGALLAALFLLPRAGHPRSSAPPREADRASADRDDDPGRDAVRAEVLDRAPIGVLVLDAGDDVVLTNRRARDLGLLERRDVAVEPLRELARLARAEAETTQEVDLETAGLPRRAIHARVRATRLADRAVALVVEDATESHRVETVRRDFVANVSHEIKTPVGALRLLADAALESMGDPEDGDTTRHFLERIAHESARLGRLVSELLDLSRLQGAEARPAPTPVRLDDVVNEAADRAAPHAEAKAITVVRGEATGAVVAGVETQLVTAVANLLDNAINYSPDGTRVGVAVKRRDEAWEITVTDQGVGIPEADLDRIFERFYRVDPARSRATGGTGLGLAIVKHVVRNHGGEVRVWSAPGAGSSFTLRLPVGAPAPSSSASFPTPSSPPLPADATGPDQENPHALDTRAGLDPTTPAVTSSALGTGTRRSGR